MKRDVETLFEMYLLYMNSFSEESVAYSEISFSSSSSSSNLIRTYPDANFVIRSLSNNHQVQKLFLKSSPQEIDAWISVQQVALHALGLESGQAVLFSLLSIPLSLSSFSLSRNLGICKRWVSHITTERDAIGKNKCRYALKGKDEDREREIERGNKDRKGELR